MLQVVIQDRLINIDFGDATLDALPHNLFAEIIGSVEHNVDSIMRNIPDKVQPFVGEVRK